MADSGLASIRDHVGDELAHAQRKRCREAGCELKLDDIPSYILLKGEEIASDRKMCDGVIFLGQKPLRVVLAELKSKTTHASDIVEKLKNGATAAHDILAACDIVPSTVDERLIVLAKRWSRSELKVLTSKRIAIDGRKRPILTKRCGIRLSSILDAN
ncbi:hypothetical protein HQ560_07140 [bacterium]|nr:hypothetical protein [bacterium]